MPHIFSVSIGSENLSRSVNRKNINANTDVENSCMQHSRPVCLQIEAELPRYAKCSAKRSAHKRVSQSPILKVIPTPGDHESIAAPAKQVKAHITLFRSSFWRKRTKLRKGTIITFVAVKKALFAG